MSSSLPSCPRLEKFPAFLPFCLSAFPHSRADAGALFPGRADLRSASFLHWDDARRADSYRLRAKVKATGVQVFNEIVQDSDGILTLPALAVGTELEITVTGRNAVGESSPTAAVTGVLP